MSLVLLFALIQPWHSGRCSSATVNTGLVEFPCENFYNGEKSYPHVAGYNVRLFAVGFGDRDDRLSWGHVKIVKFLKS